MLRCYSLVTAELPRPWSGHPTETPGRSCLQVSCRQSCDTIHPANVEACSVNRRGVYACLCFVMPMCLKQTYICLSFLTFVCYFFNSSLVSWIWSKWTGQKLHVEPAVLSIRRQMSSYYERIACGDFDIIPGFVLLPLLIAILKNGVPDFRESMFQLQFSVYFHSFIFFLLTLHQ